MPDSPENKCPRCGSEDPLIVGEACGYHPLHTPHRWHVEAPRVGVSGRINTSGGEEARAALDALKPEKPPWLGGPVKGAKADPQCPDGYPYEAERQVIAAEKALKPQPIQTYTASHTGPLGVSSEAEKDESALAPENVEWNNPGRLRQGVKDALAIERQVRLGRMDEDYELAPAAAYRKLYAEYRRLAEGQQPSTSENPDAEESPKPDPDSARRCAEPAVRAALPVIAEAGYRAGIEEAEIELSREREARNQGDFLGDDLSGEHSCHAGCPCHSGPEVHITNQSQPEPGGEGPKEPVVGEGELRARIEELAEKYEEVAALALGFASEKVSCSSVASDLRSLLVPKEEA